MVEVRPTVTPVRIGLIGTGGMARAHLHNLFAAPGTGVVVATCDPSPAAAVNIAETFRAADLPVPPHYTDLNTMLRERRGELDAAIIITPHALHHDQTTQCLEAGLDVLLEKPMVLNAAEARDLIATRDRTGKLLVIAFQGSLSAQIRHATDMIRRGDIGDLLSISGTVWQSWAFNCRGTWRMQPELSGGGFLFDTGAHMLNTVADLAGQDFTEVSAWLANRDNPVEVMGVVMGRLANGALVTLHGAGDTIGLGSDIRVFGTKAILITGQWGERLLIQRAGSRQPRSIRLPATPNTWEQFLAVREGRIENPSPPEIGLRMIRLWDAVRDSAQNGGRVVRLD
jgi:predicted dehydrogenase